MTNAHTLLEEGLSAFRTGAYQQALQSWRELLQKDPNNAKVKQLVARTEALAQESQTIRHLRDEIVDLREQLAKTRNAKNELLVQLAQVHEHYQEREAKLWKRQQQRDWEIREALAHQELAALGIVAPIPTLLPQDNDAEEPDALLLANTRIRELENELRQLQLKGTQHHQTNEEAPSAAHVKFQDEPPAIDTPASEDAALETIPHHDDTTTTQDVPDASTDPKQVAEDTTEPSTNEAIDDASQAFTLVDDDDLDDFTLTAEQDDEPAEDLSPQNDALLAHNWFDAEDDEPQDDPPSSSRPRTATHNIPYGIIPTPDDLDSSKDDEQERTSIADESYTEGSDLLVTLVAQQTSPSVTQEEPQPQPDNDNNEDGVESNDLAASQDEDEDNVSQALPPLPHHEREIPDTAKIDLDPEHRSALGDSPSDDLTTALESTPQPPRLFTGVQASLPNVDILDEEPQQIVPDDLDRYATSIPVLHKKNANISDPIATYLLTHIDGVSTFMELRGTVGLPSSAVDRGFKILIAQDVIRVRPQ